MHACIRDSDSSDQAASESRAGNASRANLALCSVCKFPETKRRNKMVKCGSCGLQYHQMCHDPSLSMLSTFAGNWQCSTCTRKSKEQPSTDQRKNPRLNKDSFKDTMLLKNVDILDIPMAHYRKSTAKLKFDQVLCVCFFTAGLCH